MHSNASQFGSAELGCIAMPGDELRGIAMHPVNIPVNSELLQVPDGVRPRPAQVSHMITSPSHLRTQSRLHSGRLCTLWTSSTIWFTNPSPSPYPSPSSTTSALRNLHFRQQCELILPQNVLWTSECSEYTLSSSYMRLPHPL